MQAVPMLNPPHPGDSIRTEVIEPYGPTVTAAAAVLKMSRPALSSLLILAKRQGDLRGRLPGVLYLRSTA